MKESHSTHSRLDGQITIFRSQWHGNFDKFHRRIIWSASRFESHTGAATTFGWGLFSSMSSKQKLNTNSSTRSELVGVADWMPKVSYFRLFLNAQNIAIKKNVVLQDNKSAMLMEENGRTSSSKRSRHLNIRSLHVTDAMSKGEIEISWWPNEQTLVDFFTKPLQGSLCKKCRAVMLGNKPITSLHN